MSMEVDNASESSSFPRGGHRDAADSKQDDHPNETESLSGQSDADETMVSSKSKDPSKPKRKKARRACAACQRAHLTCGDERPCQRCIKRNLAAHCHDGARKKAKYLRDTPNEILEPGHRPSHEQARGTRPAPFVINDSPTSQGNLSSSLQQAQSSVPLSYDQPPPDQLRNVMRGSQPTTLMPQTFSPQVYDTNDPNLYDFDPCSMQFGNRYGAMEFGMLAQISAGTYDGQPISSSTFSQPPAGMPGQIDANGDPGDFAFSGDGPITAWQSRNPRNQMQFQPFDPTSGSFEDNLHGGSQDGSHAYALGTGSGSFTMASPNSNATDPIGSRDGTRLESKLPMAQYPLNPVRSSQALKREASHLSQDEDQGDPKPNEAISKKLQTLRPPQTRVRREDRDPENIYNNVTQPYPYTAAFHRLLGGIQRRFSSQRRLRIAKALASIRPSFISSTKSLTGPDLIFMEKCFQRGLWDYEDFSPLCGTPTVVCRRTGEVAHVGKEFTFLTDWTRGVLIGLEPNLNINTHASDDGPASGAMTGSSSRGGFNTPRLSTDAGKPGDVADQQRPQKHQPVVLAELMDNESAVQFFEDYARLAYADRGSTIRRCRLLKYRTKEDMMLLAQKESEAANNSSSNISSNNGTDRRRSSDAKLSIREDVSGGAHTNGGGKPPTKDERNTRMTRLGGKVGKVDCMYCLLVKRDVFNMPMMMVVNFLPILPAEKGFHKVK